MKTQDWLNQNYPQNQRNFIKELKLYQKDLTGSLNLSDFINLEKLDCWNNNLTNLILPNNPNNLKELDLMTNNFNQDLSFLKDLVNLNYLNLGQNKFYGSLEPLKNMGKLRWLSISDTDIDSGLEYLSESVKTFRCLAEERKNARCQIIYNLLPNKKGEPKTWNGKILGFLRRLQAWKEANPDLVNNAQKIIELEKTLDNLNLALVNGKIENKTISKVLDVFQFETEERVKETRKENQEYWTQIVHNPPKSS